MKISIRHVTLVMLPLYLSLTNTMILSHNKSDLTPLAVINEKNDAIRACGKVNDSPCQNICEEVKQGKRGHRGHRGHAGVTGATGSTGPTGASGVAGVAGATGATGAAATGLAEIFLTAPMLAGCGEGPLFPTNQLLFPYGGCFSLPVWEMFYFDGVVGDGGWGAFDVPIDLDNTKPVTAVVHIFVLNTEASAGNANIEVDTDYLSNNESGGITFSDTQTSGDFTVTSSFPDYMRQITIPVSLNPALLIPGDWAFISVTRIPALTNEFQDNLWLSSISIQYSRLTS